MYYPASNQDQSDLPGMQVLGTSRISVTNKILHYIPLVMTASNIDFLVTNGYVTQADAAGLQRKLSSLQSTTDSTPAPVRSTPFRLPSLPPPAPAPAPAAPAVVQAKALWAYNLDASDHDDLSFAAGDIITIVEETNADWWLGEYGGRRALFPSNYVEKIAPAPTPAPAPRTLPPAFTPPTGVRSVPPAPTEKKEYKPFMAAHSSANAPPPPGAGTNSVGLQQDAGQDGKKSKFGKYGNTMAHSAAGGVGFGAGAAIGGGLVRAIF
ncbi:SH3-domain-containing protein [Guyanagaster necrorhizus]|uniref:SH3-domain-containing protein n=1 Tax=Guyanagaster necrorhizus TaxID=856835 RepID=A0A9P7VMU6_9AGAR|nr:SH3-domain-containing protein [Guyanagaster necrorhizus MCA 3950]KAG7442784.1 SH3-domain-containing protein [Guyanagaster necrorhizus MCA 3950]